MDWKGFDGMLIGERLRKRRKELHLTQKDVSKYLVVSKVSVSGYEKGTRTPTLPIFIKLAEILDLSMDYMVGHDYHVLSEENEEYKVKLAREDLEILSQIKENREFYNELCRDPKMNLQVLFRKKNEKSR